MMHITAMFQYVLCCLALHRLCPAHDMVAEQQQSQHVLHLLCCNPPTTGWSWHYLSVGQLAIEQLAAIVTHQEDVGVLLQWAAVQVVKQAAKHIIHVLKKSPHLQGGP